ncbi:glutathione S-transferase [Elysia marginata]|uniref:Glutathione S-transferase n=1 Tax=Elysia marginata TaxID=1093978 RepID=A0AAV4JPL6_9GAST|nr:glutathione S-transferase [Elysia marginata]
MAQPSYKLHYFPLRGRGEVPRLVLHYAKKDFLDDRIAPADWPAQKPMADSRVSAKTSDFSTQQSVLFLVETANVFN